MSRKFTTNYLRRMGRRNFIKTLTSFGVSLAGAQYMTKDTLAQLTDNPAKQVPRLGKLRSETRPEHMYDYEPIFYTIPRDEYLRTESRYIAGRQLAQQLVQEGYSGDEFEVVVKTIIDGQRNKKVVAACFNEYNINTGAKTTASEYRSFRDSVPATMEVTVDSNAGTNLTPSSSTSMHRDLTNEVDDVPVIVEKGGVKPPRMHKKETLAEHEHEVGVHNEYDEQYRPVPAGPAITVPNPDSTLSLCTGGFPVYDFEREEQRYLTAAHCVDEEPGRSVNQYFSNCGEVDRAEYVKETDYLGRLEEVFDVASIEPNSDVDLTNEMATPLGGTNRPIKGMVTSVELRDMEGDEALSLQGTTTGHDSGIVSSVSVSDGYFTTGAERDDGDSGGPHYKLDQPSDESYMAGIHQGTSLWTDAIATVFTKISLEWTMGVPA